MRREEGAPTAVVEPDAPTGQPDDAEADTPGPRSPLAPPDASSERHPRNLFAAWAAENRLSVRWVGAVPVLFLGDELVDPAGALTRCRLDHYGLPSLRGPLEDALGEWVTWRAAVERVAVVDAFTYAPGQRPAGEEAARSFVKSITGEERPVDLAAVQHFVWQVKRKALGLPVEWHLMPVLVGPQAGGKTRALRRFLEPVAPLVAAPASLKTAADDRGATLYRDALVFFVDEMGLAERTDLDLMKNRITEEYITYRVLGQNIQGTVRNNVTWIGASNKTVGELFPDYSGLRRFWQLLTPDRCDWDAVNRVDAWALWRSVDPAGPTPLTKDMLATLLAEQREEQVRDPFDIWADELVEGKPGEVQVDALYDPFLAWAERTNSYAHKPLSLARFRKRFSRRFRRHKRILHGRVLYVLGDTPIATPEQLWGPEEAEKNRQAALALDAEEKG